MACTRISTRLVRLVTIATALALLGLPVGANTSLAQIEQDEADLTLVRQPIWHQPGDDLGLVLRVDAGDAALEGFRLRVAAHDLVTTRSALHQAIEGSPGFEASSFPREFTEVVDVGAGTTVHVDDPLRSLVSLGSVPEGGGIYPISISLFDAGGVTTLDSLVTQLILLPSRPETPLSTALVIPLNALPTRAPDGSFHSDAEDVVPLETAVAEEGWLRGFVDTLDELTTPPPPPDPPRRRGRRRPPPTPAPLPPPLEVTLAPVPRFLQEVQDMGDGYRRVSTEGESDVGPGSERAEAAAAAVQTITELTNKPAVQTVLTPYAFPDLPSLSLELTIDQITRAESVLEALGITVDRSWLFPPAGRIDGATLESLRGAEAATFSFFAADSLEQPPDPGTGGCPQTFASFTCPIFTGSESFEDSRGLVFDNDVQQRFSQLATPGEDGRDLQNVFAEMAMIYFETPGVEGRVLPVTVPGVWQPPPALSRRFFKGVAEAPWLRSITARDAFAGPIEPVRRELVDVSRSATDQPDESYLSAIEQARAVLESFRSIAGSAVQARIQRLEDNLMVALSRVWWGGSSDVGLDLVEAGLAYAQATQTELEAEMAKLSIGGVDEITMTSRRGDVQFQLFSDADYPVSVVVELFADKLDFDDERLEVRIPAESTRTIQVLATAEASGTFPFGVRLVTPDGYLIADKNVTIRSTELNRVGLAVTLGALLFLIIFYSNRVIRGRRKVHGERTEATPA